MALVVMYGFVMTASAFEHHSFTCHERSRTHCSACSASQSAQQSDVGGAPIAAINALGGRVELLSVRAPHAPAPSWLSDRAPPA
jgi:hypothetical protein